MLAPNDQRHIDYCTANNGGKCPCKPRTCDGLCNNCPLDLVPGDIIRTHTAQQVRRDIADYVLDFLEGRCLPHDTDF